jgi:hypothetical protein
LDLPKDFKNRKDLMNKRANSFVPLVLFWQDCSQKFKAFLKRKFSALRRFDAVW